MGGERLRPCQTAAVQVVCPVAMPHRTRGPWDLEPYMYFLSWPAGHWRYHVFCALLGTGHWALGETLLLTEPGLQEAEPPLTCDPFLPLAHTAHVAPSISGCDPGTRSSHGTDLRTSLVPRAPVSLLTCPQHVTPAVVRDLLGLSRGFSSSFCSRAVGTLAHWISLRERTVSRGHRLTSLASVPLSLS